MSQNRFDSTCIFCRILAGELPGTVVAETAQAVAFMDINPATRGHLLVVPRTHAADLFTVAESDLSAVMVLARSMAERARERLGADGVNLIQSNGSVAWQTVFHLHVHVIPRYAGDPLVLPWHPAPGDAAEIASAAKALLGP